MRLDLRLVKDGLCVSRTKAQEAIVSGRVFVNNKVCVKASNDVADTQEVSVVPEENGFVSRAGKKLEEAIQVFGVDVKNAVVLDLGASTGGFTDCVLRHGASFVYAVDVGSGQLHESLKSDPRVENRENTNARYLKKSDFAREIDLIVTDVSFISQRWLYPAVADILPEGKYFISLIKPQFEVGKQNIGKNGIVHDPNGKLFASLLEALKEEGKKNGLTLLRYTDSPIAGGDGNREYLALWKKHRKGDEVGNQVDLDLSEKET